MNNQKPRPIPLIVPCQSKSTSKNHNFKINQEAINLIKSIPGSVSIASVCGDYRSGKSFLLNSLFFPGKGFKVSSTTEPCTKGLQIWNQPISKRGGGYIWVIDSEGFGSTQKDSSYDGDIFLLTVLISSLVLYNSYGPIDENAIQKFKNICRNSKITDPEINNISLYWVMRDFSLTMQTKEGKPLSPNQYLEQSLHMKSSEPLICNFFNQRNCIALVRPTIDENKLNNLENIELKDLRPQFVDEIYKLRKKIISTIQPKVFNNYQIDGNLLALLIQKYVQQINNGSNIFDILVNWGTISNYQCDKINEELRQKLQKQINTLTKALPLTNEDITRIQKQYTSVFIQEFHKKVSRFVNYEKSLLKHKQIIKENFIFLLSENKKYLTKQIQSYLELHFKQSHLKLKNILGLNNFPFKIFEEFKSIKEGLKSRFARYDNWDCQYYRNIENNYKIILQYFAVYLKKIDEQKNNKAQQIKKILKKLEQQNKKLKENQNQIIQQYERSIQEQKAQKQVLLLKLNSKIKQFQQQAVQQSQRNLTKMKESLKKKEESFLQIKRQRDLMEVQHVETSKLLKSKIQLMEMLLKEQEQKTMQNLTSTEQLKKQYQKKYQILIQEKQVLSVELTKKINQSFQKYNNQKKRNEQIINEKDTIQKQLITQISLKNETIQHLRNQLSQQEYNIKQIYEKLIKQQKLFMEEKLLNLAQNCQTYKKKIQLYEKKLEQQILRNEELQTQTSNISALQNQLYHKNNLIQSTNTTLSLTLEQFHQQKKNQQILFNEMEKKFSQQLQELQDQIALHKRQKNEEVEKSKQEVTELKNKINQQEIQIKEQNQNRIKQIQNFYKMELRQLEILYQNQQRILKQQLRKCYSNIESQNAENRRNIQEKQNLIKQLQQLNKRLQENQQSNRICFQCKLKDQEIINIQLELKKTKQTLSLQQESNCEQKELKDKLEEKILSLNSQIHELSYQLRILTNQQIHKKIDSKGLEEQREKQNKIKQQLLLKIQFLEKDLEKTNLELDIKHQTSLKKDQIHNENIKLYKNTIQKLRQQNQQIRSKYQSLYQTFMINKSIQINVQTLDRSQIVIGQVNDKNLDHNKQNSLETQEIKVIETSQFRQRISALDSQNKKLKYMLEQQKKISGQKRKHSKMLNDCKGDNHLQQVQEILKENSSLKKQIQLNYQKQIQKMENLKNQKIINQQNRDVDLKTKWLNEQIQCLKKSIHEKNVQLQKIIHQTNNEKYSMRQEITILKSQLDRRGFYKQRMLEQQIQIIKKQKKFIEENSSECIKTIQQNFNKKIEEYNHKISDLDLKQKKNRIQNEREKAKIIMQYERMKTKYDQLLKVNNSLLCEIQSIKRQSTASSLQNKYKVKIQSLFKN